MAQHYKGFIPLGPNKHKLKANSKPNGFPSHPASKQNRTPLQPPSPLTTPIIIRYIDPRLVPILVELGKLSEMVQNFAHKNRLPDGPKQKQELEELIKSSKDLNEKMSAIMEENDVGFSSVGEKSAQPERVSSEYKYMTSEFGQAEIKSFKDLSADETDLESIDMIEVLNRVSSRMEELEEENGKLKLKLSQVTSEVENLRQKTASSAWLKQSNTKIQEQVLSCIKEEVQEAISYKQTLQECMEKVRSCLTTKKSLTI